MKYFNGFSLKGEETLFSEYLYDSNYCVAGFSYGAQKALEYTYASTERIDKLILLSPAFFQTQKSSFIRAQLRYFEADKETYIQQFLKNVTFPSTINLTPYLNIGSVESLEALLTYKWEADKIEALLDKGITIEVFMGRHDKIVATEEALRVFNATTNYIFKDAGHLLKERHE